MRVFQRAKRGVRPYLLLVAILYAVFGTNASDLFGGGVVAAVLLGDLVWAAHAGLFSRPR